MKEIFERRSVRKYLPTPVEREKLDQILLAGAYAPSALNNQQRAFTAISSKKLLAKLNDAVLSAVDEATKQRVTARMNGQFNFHYASPVLIVVSHEKNSFCPAADCATSLQNMFLEAYSLGLGTCWINQLNNLSDTPEVRALLAKMGIPDTHAVYGCCALGYADGTTLKTPKTPKITVLED